MQSNLPQLPPEIIVKIFKYIDGEELVSNSIKLRCKYMLELALLAKQELIFMPKIPSVLFEEMINWKEGLEEVTTLALVNDKSMADFLIDNQTRYERKGIFLIINGCWEGGGRYFWEDNVSLKYLPLHLINVKEIILYRSRDSFVHSSYCKLLKQLYNHNSLLQLEKLCLDLPITSINQCEVYHILQKARVKKMKIRMSNFDNWMLLDWRLNDPQKLDFFYGLRYVVELCLKTSIITDKDLYQIAINLTQLEMLSLEDFAPILFPGVLTFNGLLHLANCKNLKILVLCKLSYETLIQPLNEEKRKRLGAIDIIKNHSPVKNKRLLNLYERMCAESVKHYNLDA